MQRSLGFLGRDSTNGLTNLPGVRSVAPGFPDWRRCARRNMNDTDIEGFVQTQDGPIQNVDFYQSGEQKTISRPWAFG